MLVSKISQKGKPKTGTRKSAAVSEDAKAMTAEVKDYLMKAVPDAQITEDFLVKVASTYGLSNRNPQILDAAVKQLKK